MRIFAYEVRPDEVDAFGRMARIYGADIELSSEVPAPATAELAAGCEGVSILGQGRADRPLLERWHETGVRYLSTRTVGHNHIDLDAARELGIKVCNATYPPNGVADFTVMMMLMCLRHYKQAMWRGQVNDFSLEGLQGRDLKDLTVGIVGTGRIGTQVMRNLSGFGCRMLAHSAHRNPAAEKLGTYVDFDTLLRESDIISLHTALTPQTWHIVNADTISRMKDGVILINCARGDLADIDALVDGIESQKIGALGMDTVEGEEGIVHADRRVDIIPNRNWFYLHQFRNVIMTQHMAFYTEQAVESMVRCGVEGIIEMARTGSCATMLS